MIIKDPLVESIENNNRKIIFYVFIVCVFLGLKFTQLLRVTSTISYVLLFIVAITTTIMFIKDRKKDVSWPALFFLLTGALSLIASPINKEFRPVERYLLFAIMFMGYGPLFQSEKTNDFRYLVFHKIQFWFVLITLASFVTYILRVPFAFGNAGFKGLTPHSMDLSPVAALSSLYSVQKLMDSQTKKIKYAWGGAALVSIATMIMGASRGAILGFFVAILYYIVIRVRKIGKSFTVVFIAVSAIIILFYVNPFSMMDNLEMKMERVERTEDITGGRDQMFQLRFRELSESPVFGVGFSSMKYSHTENGFFEAGSGWVFILSSTGILGFIFSLLMCLTALNNSRRFPKTALLSATCLFFIIHSIVEGYILTVSNGLCLYLWLVVGLSTNKYYLKKYA